MSWKNGNRNLPAIYKAWSQCSECGYQGTLDFTHLNSESYDDPESLGFLMGCQCPACGVMDHVLVSTDEYHEITGLGPDSVPPDP